MTCPESFNELTARLMADGWLERSSGQAAEEALTQTRTCAEHGCRWGELKLVQWQHEGARRSWDKAAKAGKQQFVSHSGKVLTVAGAYGIRIRDDAGLGTGAFQPALFMEMTRPQLAESVREDERQHVRMGEIILVKRGLLTIWDAYPAAKSVRELLEMAGIDLDASFIAGVI